MPLLIDGHYLIGQMKSLSLADPDDEEQLVERLSVYQRRRRSQLIVVFDSGPGACPLPGAGEAQAGLRVLFARPGQRADDVIIRLVGQERNRRACTVVTSDRAVQAAVRHLGATVISAQEFARQLEAAPAPKAPMGPKERPPSPAEVEQWLEIFKRSKRGQR